MTTRCPETEEKCGAFGDGSRNGLSGFVRGASTLDHGIQSSAGEAGCTDKTLCRLEEGLEVCLVVECAIGFGRAVIETLVDSRRCGKRCREGDN